MVNGANEIRKIENYKKKFSGGGLCFIQLTMPVTIKQVNN